MVFQIKDLDLKISYAIEVIQTTKDHEIIIGYLYNFQEVEQHTSTKKPLPYATSTVERSFAMRFESEEKALKIYNFIDEFNIRVENLRPDVVDTSFKIKKLISIEFEDEYPMSEIDESIDVERSISIDLLDKPTLVKDWNHLRELDLKSNTHTLSIDDCSGHISPIKNNGEYRDVYLSTHTFYGMTHANSTEMLRKCGFNVTIDNWDKNYPDRNSHITRGKVLCVGGGHTSIAKTLMHNVLSQERFEIVMEQEKKLKVSASEFFEKVNNVNESKSHPFYNKRNKKGRRWK